MVSPIRSRSVQNQDAGRCSGAGGPGGRAGILARVFLVGCPRSGTTLLQSLLSAHSAIHSLPETHFFQNLLSTEEHRLLSFAHGYARRRALQRWHACRRRAVTRCGWVEGSRIRRTWECFPEMGDAFEDRTVRGWRGHRLSTHVDRFVQALDQASLRLGKQVWLEKTPDHLFYAAQIQRHVPDARIIHIVRDGEEVVASLYRAAQRYPEWRPYLDIERAADRWNRALAESLAWCGRPRHLLVRYETLLADPARSLSRVLRFLECADEPGIWERYPGVARDLVRDDEPWKHCNFGALNDRRKFLDTFAPAQRQRIRSMLSRPDWWALSEQPQVVARP